MGEPDRLSLEVRPGIRVPWHPRYLSHCNPGVLMPPGLRLWLWVTHWSSSYFQEPRDFPVGSLLARESHFIICKRCHRESSLSAHLLSSAWMSKVGVVQAEGAGEQTGLSTEAAVQLNTQSWPQMPKDCGLASQGREVSAFSTRTPGQLPAGPS